MDVLPYNMNRKRKEKIETKKLRRERTEWERIMEPRDHHNRKKRGKKKSIGACEKFQNLEGTQ